MLRDAQERKRNMSMTPVDGNRPYVVVFCGVNGVGKSTNLAKVGLLLKYIFLNTVGFYSEILNPRYK